MELFKCLFAVALVAGLYGVVSAQHYWTLPQQTLPAQHQLTLPQPEAPFDKCLVEQADRIQCGAADATPDHCENINCCFEDDLCYYGKAVTVQCTRDGQFVVVVARDSTLPNIDVDSEEDGYVVYENHMSSSYEVGVGPRGSITRDSHFELLFQCRYSDTAVEALVMEVNAVPPPVPVAAAGLLRVELRLGNGQCLSNGCVEEDAAYSSFYNPADYPITKVLREPVYVEVNIVARSDANLVLNMEHCWATASPNPQSMPQWDLLVDGSVLDVRSVGSRCPYHDDRYLTTVVPVDGSSGLQYPSHYKRFIVKMFTFVDQTNYSPQKDTVGFAVR
ncbi:Zona pellucida sperm-binding protein 4 [Liparis tanakae]|uniref:Zona pellucida sperm-binding protein 4 n=1 Tax=Liparis tanakae TaxID=230148 RepID=A0A4Z2EEY0_9TELE|nr:Zona pellucida sperm-binding protein 4 [Liparis tanakae]